MTHDTAVRVITQSGGVGGLFQIQSEPMLADLLNPTTSLLLRDNYLLNRWRQRMDHAACEARVIEHLFQVGERVSIT